MQLLFNAEGVVAGAQGCERSKLPWVNDEIINPTLKRRLMDLPGNTSG